MRRYGDATEKAVAGFLQEKDIRFFHESEQTDLHLDFYLPDFDVYIEVKRFPTNRTARQLSTADNVILVQGVKSVRFLAFLFPDKTT